MSAKQITVLGDPGDEALTPEQEQALESKVDKMLDPEPRNDQSSLADRVVGSEQPAKRVTKIALKDDATPTVNTAPPLPSKGKKITTEPLDETASKEIDALPASEDEIPVSEADLSTVQPPEASLDVDLASEPDASPLEDQPPAATIETADVINELPSSDDAPAETRAPTEEQTELEDSSVKKYRPPDGPLPFKRAQPETEPKPATSGIVDDLTAQNVSQQLSQEATEPRSKRMTVAKLPGQGFGHRLAKSGRRALLALVLLIIIALAIPQTRAMALNLAHLKRSLNVMVMDSTTRAPLGNVNVQIGKTNATTDQNGKATLSKLSLGSKEVILQKPGFATITKRVFVDWRGATLPSVSLTVTGQQYVFDITDSISGTLIAGAQASVGVYTARGDAKGRIILIADKSRVGTRPVTITATGYRSQAVKLPATTITPTTVRLVPAASDFYVSKQSGRYNVYQSDIDGQHASLLLAGTGNETSHMTLVPDAGADQLAFVSTRDSLHDKAGVLLDTLTLIDVRTKAAATLAHAQPIKVVGWFGSRLVYTALDSSAATNDTNRYQLVSYDTATKKNTVLDHAPGFNDVLAVNGVIYYATADHSAGGKSQLYGIKPDASGKQTLLTSEVASIIRNSYKTLLFATATNWYSYDFTGKPVATNAGSDTEGRLYVDSPDGKHSVWIDETKHQIMLYTKATNAEKVLYTQTGLTRPARWLNNDTLVYRVVAASSADYALSVNGGTPQKITDVIDTDGLTLWHD